ncbi:MAG: 50S ribosomal protein L15 [Planctomycetota bacterium]|nr:MAG: 50S ribosomal protein L15 [Planctomycetota bacterium]
MILNDVHQGIHKHKPRKRVGRGPGSGHGKTCGRGHKGAKSRSGASRRRGYEGGQMPLFRRMAKVGFNNAAFAERVGAVNVSVLEAKFQDGDVVTVELLRQRGLVSSKCDVVKILGHGELSKALTVEAHRFSRSAEEKIAAAGGTVKKVAVTRG